MGRVSDMDHGLGADFQTECAGLHVDQNAIRKFVETESRVFGNPLGGDGGGEEGEEENAMRHAGSSIRALLDDPLGLAWGEWPITSIMSTHNFVFGCYWEVGRISEADLCALQRWIALEPEAPAGNWFKRFPSFTL